MRYSHVKVAITSSGLGHVSRGIETWAEDTALALENHRVAILSTSGTEGRQGWQSYRGKQNGSSHPKRKELNGTWGEPGGMVGVDGVVLFKGGGQARRPHERVLCCARREGLLARIAVTVLSRLGGWRYGFGSGYQIEQTTFAWRLIPELRRGGFDLVHLQDPWLALLLHMAHRAGHQPAKVILAHGTEESPEFLARFDNVQHLAPWHQEQAERGRHDKAEGGSLRPELQGAKKHKSTSAAHTETQVYDLGPRPAFSFVIPNFVDVCAYSPVKSREEKADAKARLGIPRDAFVVGTVAAVKKTHKRIDYLIREFARLSGCSTDLAPMGTLATGIQDSGPPNSTCYGLRSMVPLHLLVAGAKTTESNDVIKLVRELVPGRATIMFDVPRELMPDVYKAMDMFVLASLFEMMPIVVLEAMASGLPVIANRHPVLEWIIGDQKLRTGSQNRASRIQDAEAVTDETEQLVAKDEERLPGGECIDMCLDGEIGKAVLRYQQDLTLRERAAIGAREQAVRLFSRDLVVDQILDMYHSILAVK